MISKRNGLEKKGDALSPLLLKLSLDYVIRRFEVNQDGLKLNGTYQVWVYADNANKLCDSVQTIKKQRSLVVDSKETRLEVNVDKMGISPDQNAGRSQNMKTDNIPLKKWKSSNNWGQT
jgi:hypothetical protein